MEAQVLSIKDQESGIKTLEELFKNLTAVLRKQFNYCRENNSKGQST